MSEQKIDLLPSPKKRDGQRQRAHALMVDLPVGKAAPAATEASTALTKVLRSGGHVHLCRHGMSVSQSDT